MLTFRCSRFGMVLLIRYGYRSAGLPTRAAEAEARMHTDYTADEAYQRD